MMYLLDNIIQQVLGGIVFFKVWLQQLKNLYFLRVDSYKDALKIMLDKHED